MKGKERLLDKNNMTLKLEKMTISQVSESRISRNELSKKKSLQEKGITLIALVVTIIILLILAGVTLKMALSQNGLFSKTQEAADKYKQAQSDEEEMIRQIATQMNIEYVGAEVTGYIPTGESENCTLGTDNTGYESPQTFTRKEMTWRVWDFDGNTLRLIGEPTDEMLYLEGVKGYNNGVWAMDHICKELYSNNRTGVEVTTLKRSDILKVSTIDFTNSKHGLLGVEVDSNESNNINYGQSYTYETGNFIYPDIWYSNDKKWLYTKENQEDKYGEIFETIGNTDGTNDETESIQNEKITFKDNYSWGHLEGNLINDNYLNLLIGNLEIGSKDQCWLGSRENNIWSDNVGFCLSAFSRQNDTESEYGFCTLCNSRDGEIDRSVGGHLVPVVSIDLNKSGCTLEKNGKKSENGSDIYNLKFS